MNFENIELSKEAKTPLYLQLKEIILKAILKKELIPGDLLPSESMLAQSLGISKATVRQCMSELSNEGYVEKRRNRGTIILNRKLDIGYSNSIGDFGERVKELGMVPKTELLTLAVEPCTKETAQLLNISEDKKIIHLSRMRYANDLPIVYIDSYLPYEENRFILGHNLEEESLYSVLDQDAEARVHTVERTVFASEALPEIAEKFRVRPGCAMLTVETTAYNHVGKVVEHSISYSPNSRNQYNFRLKR